MPGPPFPNGFIRQSLLWQLPEGEVASINFAWDAFGMTTLSSAGADTFGLHANALWAAIKDRYHGLVKYQGSRIVKFDSGGITQQTYERFITPDGGTGTGDNLPTEVAVCVSLGTALGGRRYRGRVFLPNVVSGQMTAYGRLSAAAAADFSVAVADYCGDLTTPDGTCTAVVASATYGLLTPITSVSVGDVFDVQRRRRDALVEVRVTTPVT